MRGQSIKNDPYYFFIINIVAPLVLTLNNLINLKNSP